MRSGSQVPGRDIRFTYALEAEDPPVDMEVFMVLFNCRIAPSFIIYREPDLLTGIDLFAKATDGFKAVPQAIDKTAGCNFKPH